MSLTFQNNNDRFFALLKKMPRLESLWDRSRNELKPDLFEHALKSMSHGEIQMALFFASVWFNDNERYGFDLVDAVSQIDPQGREIIIQWLSDPFWP